MIDLAREVNAPALNRRLFVGTAGWSVPALQREYFPLEGTHLERYAGCFRAAEINSSFYHAHQPRTYAKWAASVPDGFRFAVKVPKQITHEKRLRDAQSLLDDFLIEVDSLGEKLGPLLVQLPPSLAFNEDVVAQFFSALRERFSGFVVCEPRHATWFSPQAENLLTDYQIARAAVDPFLVPSANVPGGCHDLVYYRLHGSPRMYYSNYSHDFLTALAYRLRQAREYSRVWCIFDNTAEFAATANALTVMKLAAESGEPNHEN